MYTQYVHVFYEVYVRERDLKKLIILCTLCAVAQIYPKRVQEVTTCIL